MRVTHNTGAFALAALLGACLGATHRGPAPVPGKTAADEERLALAAAKRARKAVALAKQFPIPSASPPAADGATRAVDEVSARVA